MHVSTIFTQPTAALGDPLPDCARILSATVKVNYVVETLDGVCQAVEVHEGSEAEASGTFEKMEYR